MPPRSTKPKPEKPRISVQFDVASEDDADLVALVGELKSRAPVARLLFLYGLSHSEAAFAWYAKPHQQTRMRRLSGGADLSSEADEPK